MGLPNRLTAVAIALVVVLFAWLIGCNDHRISLAEFLALEQEMQHVHASTTQPAISVEDVQDINQQLSPYKVGNGDVLLVTLMTLDAAESRSPIQVRVDRTGTIKLPTAGAILIAGKELEDVEEAIRQAYVPNIYRDILVMFSIFNSVKILTHATKRYYENNFNLNDTNNLCFLHG